MNTPSAPTVLLNNGVAMPRLGLGTWPLKGADAQRTVAFALNNGYRLIDTATAYGNESAVGRGIRAADVAREDIFVTTKLRSSDHGHERTLRAVDASVAALGLEYIDLFLIHWPVPSQNLYVETWQALRKVLADGHVRAIGVSNFKPAHLERVIGETGTVPAVNQIQLSPLTSQAEPRAYHRNHHILTESWSPLGKGTDLLGHPTVTGLASKYGKSPGQIVLRWHMDLGLAAIPKSNNPQRIISNIDIFDFVLTPEEVESLCALDTGAAQPVDSDAMQPGLMGPETP
ncbi:oxidoreductase [Streptomyces umbrinus]|uniref:aldo/keto reductase n=1 Tax=Streptomyces umbrinus TaxID=67370 RepID=UPI0016730564|nr:aldo/keto reductase [Streptomyces umbrinus]GHB60226.1 oxidoreductase [Streptomyces umbrinus]